MILSCTILRGKGWEVNIDGAGIDELGVGGGYDRECRDCRREDGPGELGAFRSLAREARLSCGNESM